MDTQIHKIHRESLLIYSCRHWRMVGLLISSQGWPILEDKIYCNTKTNNQIYTRDTKIHRHPHVLPPWVHWTKPFFNFSKSWFSKLVSLMWEVIWGEDMSSCTEQLLVSSASWQGSVFCLKNSCLIIVHATTVIVSVDGLSRYSSSCVRADELSRFLTKKLSSSSKWSDAWSSGVASCITVRRHLMNFKP